jgi:hypothetical protein
MKRVRAVPEFGTVGEVMFEFALPLGTCLAPKFLFLAGGPFTSFTARRGPESNATGLVDETPETHVHHQP